MSKKHYFILSPAFDDQIKMTELEESAALYYGDEYEDILSCIDLNKTYGDMIKQSVTKSIEEANASLLMIGLSVLCMAQCDSIYVAKDWEKDDCCKFCYALAFSHGVDIVHELV